MATVIDGYVAAEVEYEYGVKFSDGVIEWLDSLEEATATAEFITNGVVMWRRIYVMEAQPVNVPSDS